MRLKSIVFALAILSFNANPVFAQIAQTSQLKESIPNRLQIVDRPSLNIDADDAETDLQQSDELVKAGNAAENEGNSELAIRLYYAAIKENQKNGHAWYYAGRLMLKTDILIGTECLMTALKLFEVQGDTDCYENTFELLKSIIDR